MEVFARLLLKNQSSKGPPAAANAEKVGAVTVWKREKPWGCPGKERRNRPLRKPLFVSLVGLSVLVIKGENV
jgi:hypothetical protein